MCRQRVNSQAICSSENYAGSKRLHYEYLKENHQKRVEAIRQMEFKITSPTVKHNHLRAYVMIWGTKVYIPKDKIQATVGCGMKVYYE